MKYNVDLTIDSDFSNSTEDRIKNLVFSQMSSKLIWNKILDEEIEYNSDEIFITGNKEERKRKKFYNEFLKTCEKCGIDLETIPWKSCDSLCSKCDEELKKRYDNLFWIF